MKTKQIDTPKTKKSTKSESPKITERQKEVVNFCKVLTQVNNSGTKLTEIVRVALASDRDLLTGTALYIYYKDAGLLDKNGKKRKGSESQRLNTLQRTIKRVSKDMSKEEGSSVKPVKLKMKKEGDKVYYTFIDNTTTDQDKYTLLLNHINRELDNLTNQQREEIISIVRA